MGIYKSPGDFVLLVAVNSFAGSLVNLLPRLPASP